MIEPVIISKKLMGSPFAIKAYPENNKDNNFVRQAVELAFLEISRVESLLTDFKDSPFNKINDFAGIRPVKVTEEIFSLIDFSKKISQESEGAFDISYASVGAAWRKAFKSGIPPDEKEIQSARAFVDYRKIELNYDSFEVFLPLKGMKIGLGSIGKSYAVDSAFKFLRTKGLRSFLVNGAGDIRASSSSSAPRAWKVGIRNPFAGKNMTMGIINISAGAVATSGDYERFISHGGKKYHHIIDARSSSIRDDISSVTVFAHDTVNANAYSTAAMCMGAEDGARLLTKKDKLKGLIIVPSGKVIPVNIS